MFYVDEVRIAGRHHEWLQDALTVKLVMFRRMELGTNLEKIKVMVCTPGII